MRKGQDSGKKKKRRHRSEKRISKDKLLKLWSAAAFHIYGSTCCICKKRRASGTHHYFGKKSHPSVMFDIRNALPSCFACHIIQIHQQGDTEHARNVMIERLGIAGFINLERDAHQLGKLSLLDHDAIQAKLSSLLD